MRRYSHGLWLLLPGLAGFAALFLIPFVLSFYFSFFQGIGSTRFVAFANYRSVIASGSFRLAVTNTLTFVAIGIPALLVLGMGMACLADYLHRAQMRGHTLWLALSMLPMVVPTSSVVLFFRACFEDAGFVNTILARFGVAPVRWLASDWGFWVLMLVYLWKNIPYCMVLLLAGMRSIDRNSIEAAALDGAGAWSLVRYIRLPQIIPFVYFSTVIGLIQIFKIYRESYQLAGDYPHESMYMLQNYMNNAFSRLNTQGLSAASVLFFAVMFAVLVFMSRHTTKS